MARAALGWGVRDLARFAKVSTGTISRLEAGEQLKDRTLADLRTVFESAGIEFWADNGVRLKAKPDAPTGGSTPGSGSTRKPATPAKPSAPDRQATAAQTKEAQIRALRASRARSFGRSREQSPTGPRY
jgi:transcriptional regulator with XRE-family HTH domain